MSMKLESSLPPRPRVTEKQVIGLVQRVYGLTVTELRQQNSYEDKSFHIKVAETGQNPHLKRICAHGYVLKVLNTASSSEHVDAELAMQQLLLENGLNCPRNVLNVHGESKSLEKIVHETSPELKEDDKANISKTSELHIVRLAEFIPGTIFHSVPYMAYLLFEIGEFAAKMHNVLQDFHHEALGSHQTMWSFESIPHLRRFVYAVRDNGHRDLVGKVVDAFESEVLPQYPNFRKGVVHGDVSDQNLLVREIQGRSEKKFTVQGILDFGDATDSYYVFDVGVMITYLSIDSKVVDRLSAGGHVLAGYLKHRALNDHEFDALKLCAAARCCQSLVLGEYTYSMDPGNEYVLTTAKKGWSYLKALWECPKDDLYKKWRDIIKTYE